MIYFFINGDMLLVLMCVLLIFAMSGLVCTPLLNAIEEVRPPKPVEAELGVDYEMPLECPHCKGEYIYGLRVGQVNVVCQNCNKEFPLPRRP